MTIRKTIQRPGRGLIPRHGLMAAMLLALALALARAGAADPPRPNLVLVLFDDLNTTAMSCYGQHPDAHTPHLDRLAASGLRFTAAMCNAPICGPSRASLLCGLLPSTSGYFGWKQQEHHWRSTPALAQAVTFLRLAAQRGYHLYGCGKIWHNGHEEYGVFGNNFGPKPSHGPYGPKVDETEVAARLAAAQTTGLNHSDAFGPLSEVPPGGWPGFRYVSEDQRSVMSDESNAKWAVERLRGQPMQEPFLLVVGFNRPHVPFTAPTPYFGRLNIADTDLALARPDDTADLAPEFRGKAAFWTDDINRRLWQRLFGPGDGLNPQRYTRAYLACTSFADAQFGRVLDALDASEYAARTWVIATSDHGYHLGEKGRSFKNTVWEEACKVPLLIRGPQPPGAPVCTRPVSLVDLYPTLADLGAWNDAPRLDGHSLLPLYRDPAGSWAGPEVALTSVEPPWEGEPPPLAQRRAMQNYSLRSERWRYIRGCRGGEELYDHAADPHEWTNLAGYPQHAELLTGLRRRLGDITGVAAWPDPATVPLPDGIGQLPGDRAELRRLDIDLEPRPAAPTVVGLDGGERSVPLPALGPAVFDPVSADQEHSLNFLPGGEQ